MINSKGSLTVLLSVLALSNSTFTRLLDADVEILLGSKDCPEDYDSEDTRDPEDRIDGFRPFSKDQCIRFATSLPKSLQHLTIRQCANSIFDCVRIFLSDDVVLPLDLETMKVR